MECTKPAPGQAISESEYQPHQQATPEQPEQAPTTNAPWQDVANRPWSDVEHQRLDGRAP